MDARRLPAAARAILKIKELGPKAVDVLESGQPAMAPIWHLAVAARSPDPPPALAALHARLTTDADAAVEAATGWLLDRLAAHPGRVPSGAVATVSHSSLVDRVLGRVDQVRGRVDQVRGRVDRVRGRVLGACESPTPRTLGPQHGRVAEPGSAGARSSTGRDQGARSSTAQDRDQGAGSSAGPVVGVVGADAIGPEGLLNADGTRELAGRVPTLVVATAVKLVPAEVFGRLGGAGFEVVQLEALAAVVVGAEVLSPAEAGLRARALTVGPGD